MCNSFLISEAYSERRTQPNFQLLRYAIFWIALSKRPQ